MNRTKSFFYNTISSIILQAVITVSGFITPKIMLTFYGSQINGLTNSILQFISYFSLVEAGLASAAVYALYNPLYEHDHKQINGIITAAKNFYIYSGYIFTGLTVFLAVLYPFYIKSDALTSKQMFVLILILGVNGALDFFTLAKYRVLLTADQKSYVISIASAVHILLSTAVIICLSYARVDIVLLRLAAASTILIRSLILVFYCKKKYRFLDYHETPNNAVLDKRWNALYLQILGSIHTSAPVVLLTLILKDLTVVSIYAVFNMIIAGINGLLTLLANASGASFGNLLSLQEHVHFKKAYQEFELFYYNLITFVYSVTFITIMPFIKIYTQDITDTNYYLPSIGFLFVLNALLYNIKTPQGILLIAAGLFKESRWQTTFQGLLAVGIGFFLTPKLQIAGVLIGLIISNIYRDIDLIRFIPRYLPMLTSRPTIFRIIRLLAATALVTLPFQLFPVTVTNYPAWIVLALAASFLSLAVIFIFDFVFDRQDMKLLLLRIHTLLCRKEN